MDRKLKGQKATQERKSSLLLHRSFFPQEATVSGAVPSCSSKGVLSRKGCWSGSPVGEFAHQKGNGFSLLVMQQNFLSSKHCDFQAYCKVVRGFGKHLCLYFRARKEGQKGESTQLFFLFKLLKVLLSVFFFFFLGGGVPPGM